LLRDETTTCADNTARTGNATVITYGYDADGNLITRAPANATSSSYTYDGLDRVTHISHGLNGTTRTFDYAYDSVSNRKWTKRDGGNGDVFGYDLNDQVTATKLNITNPDTTPVGSQTIVYDANGNRTTFSAYGPTDTYTTNNLNQYTARNSSNAIYDNDGNMTSGLDGSTYTYDAQNRLLTAFNGTGTMNTFKYDGLNRQVSRKVGGGGIYYRVYDGWDLLGEYASGSTSAFYAYVYGAGGVIRNLVNNHYYYQDASGSTTHLANSAGALIEWYRYDLQGKPVFYNASNNQINGTAYGVRHLFTGQQWYSEIGLYDLRNRFYSPDAGRFLQGDPSGFGGDPTNLYRYCGNNPLKRSDPTGLVMVRVDGARQYGPPRRWTDPNDAGGPLNGGFNGAGGVSDGLGFGGLAFYGGATLGLDIPGTGLVTGVPQGTVTVGFFSGPGNLSGLTAGQTQAPDGSVTSSDISADYDGSPGAYAPLNSGLTGLDSLANATTDQTLNGPLSPNVIVFSNGQPVIGPDGYYVTATSLLSDPHGNLTVQSTYINGSVYPYVALGSGQTFGAQPGDYVGVNNNENGAYIMAVYGDYRGSNNNGIELSPAALQMVGISYNGQSVTPTSVTIDIYPGSGH
jgi:RHS repeat-associated protein